MAVLGMLSRPFVICSILLTALWTFANWPHAIGKGIVEVAGFPVIYAAWTWGELDAFDLGNLIVNCFLGVFLVLAVSWFSVWSMHGRQVALQETPLPVKK